MCHLFHLISYNVYSPYVASLLSLMKYVAHLPLSAIHVTPGLSRCHSAATVLINPVNSSCVISCICSLSLSLSLDLGMAPIRLVLNLESSVATQP